MQVLPQSPFLLYSDGKGNIYEDKTLFATGRSGWDALPVPDEDWIKLPEGGLYELPGRSGIGIDVITGEMRLCEKGWAVAAFIRRHTQGYSSRLMKPGLRPLPCRFSAIRLQAGLVISSMYPQYE